MAVPRLQRVLWVLGLCVWARAAAAQADPIAFHHLVAPSYPAGEDLVLEGRMQNASDVERAEVWFRPMRPGAEAPDDEPATDEDIWNAAELELLNETDYRAVIPAEHAVAPGLVYYVVAYDFLGNPHPAFASPEAPGVLNVTGSAASSPGAHTITAQPADAADVSDDPAPPPPETPSVSIESTDLPATLNPAPGVTVMDAERIRALGARHLIDLLDLCADVLVERRADGGYQVRIRGSERPGDVLVRVNGIPIQHRWDADGPWTFPAPFIERLTVRRPNALGPDTLGGPAGVIDIETRLVQGVDAVLAGGAFATHLTAESPGDRWGSYRADVLGGYQIGRFHLGAAAHVDASSGTQPGVPADQWRLTGSPSQTPGAAPDGRLQGDGMLSLRIDDLLGGTLTSTARYRYREHGGYFGKAGTFDPEATVSEHVAAFHAAYEVPLERPQDRVEARVGFDWRGRDERFALAPPGLRLLDRDGDGAEEVFPDGIREHTSLGGWNAYATVQGEGDLVEGFHLLGGATLWSHGADLALSRNVSLGGAPTELSPVNQPAATGDLTRVWAAAFIDSRWQATPWMWMRAGLWAGWMSGVPGARGEQSVGPRVELGFVPHPTVALSLVYRGATRLPTFEEAGDARAQSLPAPLDDGMPVGARLGGPALHTVAFDSHWEVREGPWRTQLALQAYYELTQQRISIWAVPGQFTARDLHHRVGWGAEATASYGRRVELYAAADWKRDLDQGDRLTEVTDAPQFSAVLQLRVELTPVGELAVGARYLSERRNDARTPAEQAASYQLPETFTTLATFRSVPLWNVLRLGIRAHHLFDGLRLSPSLRSDGVMQAIPHEGLSVMGTAEITWDGSTP